MMELWNPFLAAKKNQQMCDNPTILDCYMTQKICDKTVPTYSSII